MKRIGRMAIVFLLLVTIVFSSSAQIYASNAYYINGKYIHWDDFSSSPDECWVYANNIYNKIWGKNFSNSFSDSDNSLRNLSDAELTLTAEHLKKYVTNAALGSSLRICNSNYLHGTDGWGHSQIIVQKDANGFTVFEGGLSSYPYCREKYYTWNEYITTGWLGGSYAYIKYIKWPGASAITADSPLAVLNTVYCKHTVVLPARVINLYLNPTDSSRYTYFDYGPTISCPAYAKLSNGTTMFLANVNHQGNNMQMWFRYESDMTATVKHTFGNVQYDREHPHAEYRLCDCGHKEYTGNYGSRSDCEECAPHVVLSESAVALDLRDASSRTITVSTTGELPSQYALRYTRKTDCCTCKWENSKLNIYAEKRGSGYITISLIDKSENEEKTLDSIDLYVNITAPTYTVSYHAAGGEGAPASQTKYYNETLTLSTEIPYREGYEFFAWAWQGPSGQIALYSPGESYSTNGSINLFAIWRTHTYSYTDGKCTVCGAVDPDYECDGGANCPTKAFSDIIKTQWYHDAIDYAVEHELFNGTSSSTFEPEGEMTRAMLVTVLWRSAGKPVEGTNTFSDVPNDQYYAQPVAWAAANGIVTGTSSTTFAPDDNVTREQLATILYRYTKKLGVDVSTTGDLTRFSDHAKANDWASDALKWAVGVGIISGDKQGSTVYLDPQGNATRAQVATIFMRYLENVVK